VSARRPAVDHTPAESRDEIQNFVTYHTKRLDAIENRVGKEKSHSFSSDDILAGSK
jgi:hypothetical protein